MITLFAGPYVGEFGWELMGWQAKIRHLSQEFDRTVVATRLPMYHLYKDFADAFVQVAVPKCTLCSHESAEPPVVEHWAPEPNETVTRITPINSDKGVYAEMQNKFLHYGARELHSWEDMHSVVLVHARSIVHGSDYQTERNWGVEKWDGFVDELSSSGYVVMAIGHPEYSFCPIGAQDKRRVSLSQLAFYMNHAVAVCGPSSGPMHYASLCKAPHLVWTSNQPNRGGGNRERYEHTWNPFGTPCVVVEHDTWGVPTRKVIDGFKKLTNAKSLDTIDS